MQQTGQVVANGRRGAARPRVVLFWVVVTVAVALGVYAAAPWLLPARIREGPLVQMTGTDHATLVWYLSRPADCNVTVTVNGQTRSEAAQADGRRNEVEIAGLTPGTTYPYEIRIGRRALTKGLAFETARAADGGPYTFLVFGDSGRGGQPQYELAAAMERSLPPPDFLLHTGDMVYPDGARKRYEARFFTPYRHLLARVNFWPCVGNHDVDKQGHAYPMQEVFEVPANGPEGLPAKRDYWFDYANCRIAVVDTDFDEATLRDRVAPWLRTVMSEPGPVWRFVSIHHPPYTGGGYGPDVRVQKTLVPVFDETGVDIVFCGHDHSYQRTAPLREGQIVEPGQGVVYIITAAGGARLYPPKGPRPEYLRVHDYTHYSFSQVMIAGGVLTLRQIDSGGQTLDEFTLDKSPTTSPTTAPTP